MSNFSVDHTGSDVISRKAYPHICVDCNGLGIVYWDELADYHRRTYNTKSKDCKRCEGYGIVVRITRVNERPFNESERKPARHHNGKYNYDG